MFRICSYLVTRILFLIMIIGIAGFVGGLLVQMRLYKVIPDSFEMPLGSLSGIAVDSEGKIYCGSQFYARVQVYDTEGKFLHGMSLNTSGGMFWIRINSNDQLEVAALRGEQLIRFDKNGKLLSSRSGVPNFSDGFDKESGYYCYDEQRDITYRIESILLPLPEYISIFGLHVIKKDSSGKETVIIKTPFLKWLFMGPFPALFFVVFGTYSSIIANKKFRNRLFRCKDTMYKRVQPEHKTKSGEFIKKRSIIVALVSLGITGIAMISMYILLFMNEIDLQPGSTLAGIIIIFVFLGIIKGECGSWLMGRILGLISAIVLTIIALICLVFIGNQPYMLPTIILIGFQVIFLFVMYYSLGTVEARKYCNVLCSKCGKNKIETIDLVFSKEICRKCGKEWS